MIENDLNKFELKKYSDQISIVISVYARINREVHLRPSQQLEHEDTQRPVVNGSVVAFVEDDFGCHVFGGTAERPRLVANTQHFREAEIHLFSPKQTCSSNSIHAAFINANPRQSPAANLRLRTTHTPPNLMRIHSLIIYIHTQTYTNTRMYKFWWHSYIYIYIYGVCVCARACVCACIYLLIHWGRCFPKIR